VSGFNSKLEEDVHGIGLYMSQNVDPIPDCIGLSREKWCKKEVAFQNDEGDIVATAYVEFAKECQTIDGRTTLGEDNVGVFVCEVW
jgi:hypothetical protein